jgi:hypothetical protein
VSESLTRLVAELRKFDDRKAVMRELRAEIRKPLPVIRKEIKARAETTLPRAGGLNRWAAGTKITLQVKMTGRSAGVRIKGGRNSKGGRSDIRALDRGRLRHPSWGRRGRGQWHTQQVIPGFFTRPATEADQWRQVCVDAVEKALRSIRG